MKKQDELPSKPKQQNKQVTPVTKWIYDIILENFERKNVPFWILSGSLRPPLKYLDNPPVQQ